MNSYLAGFDIGATKLALVIADYQGSIVYRYQEGTEVTSNRFVEYKDGLAYLGIADQMIRVLHQGIAATGGTEISGIGIDSAGPLRDGDIRNSTNINPTYFPGGEKDKPLYIPLVKPLQREFRVPVRLENDCNTTVLGEVYYGIGRDVPDKTSLFLVYITISTGVGGGVWDGGHLVIGKHGNAAEVGHFLVKRNGLRCGCGNLGCFEAYCSGSGIANNARMQLQKQGKKSGAILRNLVRKQVKEEGCSEDPEPSDSELFALISPVLVFEAAADGDPLAQEVIDEACTYGGIGLADIANAYDPQIITVGGTLAFEHPEILKSMREEMLRHLNVEPPEVLLTPLGYQVVEYGTIVLARQAADLRCK